MLAAGERPTASKRREEIVTVSIAEPAPKPAADTLDTVTLTLPREQAEAMARAIRHVAALACASTGARVTPLARAAAAHSRALAAPAIEAAP